MLCRLRVNEDMRCVVSAVVLQSALDDAAFCLSYIAGFAFSVSTGYMVCNVVQTFVLGFVFDDEF